MKFFKKYYECIREKLQRYLKMKISIHELITSTLSILAIIISVWTYDGFTRQNENALYLGIINARIQSCMGIANFHKDVQSGAGFVTDKNKLVSTVAERKDKAANLSRELTLCLAKSAGMKAVESCVKNANDNAAYKVHDDVSSSTDSGTKKGQDNLAC